MIILVKDPIELETQFVNIHLKLIIHPEKSFCSNTDILKL